MYQALENVKQPDKHGLNLLRSDRERIRVSNRHLTQLTLRVKNGLVYLDGKNITKYRVKVE